MDDCVPFPPLWALQGTCRRQVVCVAHTLVEHLKRCLLEMFRCHSDGVKKRSISPDPYGLAGMFSFMFKASGRERVEKLAVHTDLRTGGCQSRHRGRIFARYVGQVPSFALRCLVVIIQRGPLACPVTSIIL